MSEKMILVLKGLIKVYEDDMIIMNTFYKAFEYNDDLPSEENIIKQISTLRNGQ